MQSLWLAPSEKLAKSLGYKNLAAMYRDIRLGQFPFRFVKVGKRIRISARSIELITEGAAQAGDQSLATTTPARV